VPASIGTIVSRGFASLHELDTVYGTADLYDMIEIISVDAYNQRIVNKPRNQ
jgi:4-diphosphocytidyl-2C-methyl-D-erythritol kinase